jgi:hypothetical protein
MVINPILSLAVSGSKETLIKSPVRPIELLVGHPPELDRTTSHSTKLSKNDSKVAGYVEGFVEEADY